MGRVLYMVAGANQMTKDDLIECLRMNGYTDAQIDGLLEAARAACRMVDREQLDVAIVFWRIASSHTKFLYIAEKLLLLLGGSDV